MGTVHQLQVPEPLPVVHTCGCKSQVFYLCADGRVVCAECRCIITPLQVIEVSEDEVP